MRVNTRLVIDIETDRVLEREGYEYQGPLAQAVAATAVTKVGELNANGGRWEYYTFSIDVGALTISTQEIETIAVTGARSGDPCRVTLEAPEAGVVAQGAKVTANDVVSFYMGATLSINPAAYVGHLEIMKRTV